MQMHFTFSGQIIYWRGPAPWFFVAMPAEESQELKAVSDRFTYGWGVIPVQVRIGETAWTTSLFPKDGLYLVPLRADIRRAEDLKEGDEILVELVVQE